MKVDKQICDVILKQIIDLEFFIKELSQKKYLLDYEKKDLEDSMENIFAMKRVYQYFGGKTI